MIEESEESNKKEMKKQWDDDREAGKKGGAGAGQYGWCNLFVNCWLTVLLPQPSLAISAPCMQVCIERSRMKLLVSTSIGVAESQCKLLEKQWQL